MEKTKITEQDWTPTTEELDAESLELAISKLIDLIPQLMKIGLEGLRNSVGAVDACKTEEMLKKWFMVLSKITGKYQEDAEKMTAFEFFEAHPDFFTRSFDKAIENTNYKDIPALKSIVPKIHIKPNTKLSNEMTKGADMINSEKFELLVSKVSAKKEICTTVKLTYDDKYVTLSSRRKFTPYDREVHDAVVTLYVAGNVWFTSEMVYRAMNGMTESEKVSPQAVAAVTKSIDKARFIAVEIDFSQEAKAYNKSYDKAKYESYLLACNKTIVLAGGKKKEGYKLLDAPILYRYAQVSGQIINVPIKLLQTKEGVRSTDEVIVIRGYLIRQIEGIKSMSFKRSNNIVFDGIYTELGVSTESHDPTAYKNKTRTLRKHVDSILTEWIKQDYIKRYNPYKVGKTIKGISITL